DAKALDDIFTRSALRIERMARRMLRGSFERVAAQEQTGDVVQEASLRLVRALREMYGKPEERVKSPLEFFRLTAQMMRRALIDLSRHHYGPEGSAANRANPPRAGASTAPGFDAAGNTDHNPEALAAWTDFHEAAEKLPSDLHDVFDLLWYDDLSQDEAAN